MISIKQCPVCDTNLPTLSNPIKDHSVSHETFGIVYCPQCELGITTPRPEDQQLSRYYESEDYISHSGKTRGVIGNLYRIARSLTLKWKKELIEKYQSPGSILDYGCGTGEFLHAMKTWDTSGVEPSALARDKANTLTQGKIKETFDQLEKKNFNAITLWHVLEHIPDLNEKLKTLSSCLAKDGTIFIAVPNYKSYDASKYGMSWAGYDVPRHLWHFTRRSMRTLFAKHNLKLIGTEPMKLDSFYVSILSEKYNDNKGFTGLIKALYTGLKSNQLAARNKELNNYSSIIYIATKK